MPQPHNCPQHKDIQVPFKSADDLMFYGLFIRTVLFALLVGLASPPQVQAEHGGPPSDPDTICTRGETVELRLELGQGIPLPRQYNGSTVSGVTITGTMLENMFFGPEHVVSTHVIPKGLGVNLSESPVVPTTTSTPLGTSRVRIEFTTDKTGSTVIARCDYQVTLVPPAELLDLIQVPVRWCAVEGSRAAADKKPNETVSGTKLLSWLERVNDEVWVPGAKIVFRPAHAAGIPVIADPRTPPGRVGDIDVGGFDPLEPGQAMTACERWWAEHYRDQRGIILVNARELIGAGATLGVTPKADQSLWVESRVLGTGERGDDLCGHPRQLTVADVLSEWVVVADQDFIYDPSEAQVLAHELGHVLLLGHGNGLDDNHDGLEPPSPGLRRFDEYCDPLWLAPPQNVEVDEDKLTPVTTCAASRSLMHYIIGSGCTNLQPLQVEMARAVAKVVPGATFDPLAPPIVVGEVFADFTCPQPPCASPDVSIIKVAMSETPDSQTTTFSQTIVGPIPPDANNRYLIFADLDDNPATGGAPSALGFPTSFQGAELVALVSVGQRAGSPQVTATLWKYQAKTFVQVTDPRIRAAVVQQTLADVGRTGHVGSIVTLRLPNEVRGSVEDWVRVQAIAQQLAPEGQLDRLPTARDRGSFILRRSSTGVMRAEGKVALLRVHDVGTKFGPSSHQIDAEVVIRLKDQFRAYSFQLRNDENRPARLGMLDLLRDAFNHDGTVTLDYKVQPPEQNGMIIRVWLMK